MAQNKNKRKNTHFKPAQAVNQTNPNKLMEESRALAELFFKGSFAEAESRVRKLLKINPSWGFGWKLLAGTCAMISKNEDALHASVKATRLLPNDAEVFCNHGNILKDLGRLTEAIEFYKRAIELRPDFAVAHNNLGNALKNQGRLQDAVEAYENALKISPGFINAYDNLLFALHYIPGLDGNNILELHKKWDEKLGLPASARQREHKNRPEPDRALNIGYISADLGQHPVGIFTSQILKHHDREKCKVFCYSDRKYEDDLSGILATNCDYWRRIVGMSHDEVVDVIRKDGIDILIDLAGHTAGNRLPVFAIKPAPIQVTWLGYPDTTGLKEMGYILMDDSAVLPGEERFFSEKVIKLPLTRFCYAPPASAPEIAPLPAATNGYATFGSFNNLAKVTPSVIDLWSKVLRGVPGSRLLLKSAPLGFETVQNQISLQFEALGVDRSRLLLQGVSPHSEMLAEYGKMDVALDPFPFNGGLTSCEALWMGVPVLTMAGNRPISRQTTGFLRTAGIEGFIGKNENEYVELAIKWSSNIDKLAGIRAGLRDRIKSSPLCDGKRFTANLEAAYRDMWKKWCNSRSK